MKEQYPCLHKEMPRCKIHKQEDKVGYVEVNQKQPTSFKTQALGNMRTKMKWSMKNTKRSLYPIQLKQKCT